MPTTSRRQFLKTIKFSAALTGLAVAGVAFHETAPPALVQGGEHIFDFRAPGNGPALALALGNDRAQLLDDCLRSLGGIKRFIAPGDRVLLKVNAGFASPPEIGATTNPVLLAAAIEQCRAAGAARILVSDNPIGNASESFQINGLAEAALKNKAELLIPSQKDFSLLTLPGGRLIRNWPVMLPLLRGVDKVVGLAPVKDHIRASATMGIKNWYGLLGGRRGVFHQDIHQIVLELAMLVRPTLSIVDGVQTMIQNGPTGGSLDDLKNTNTMIAGTDPVAVDAYAAGLLNLNPYSIGYLRLCQEAGLGTLDTASLLKESA